MSITIGTILKTVGLQGELKVSPLTHSPQRFDRLQDVTIKTKEGQPQQYRIERVRYAFPFVYIKLAGISSLEEAQLLAGGALLIPDEERMPLPKGSYYHFEIEGLDVFLENGTRLGKLEQILETGSNDVYVVKQDGKEYLIPALASVVKEINLKEGRMIIRPLQGLLEL
ncbi:MAG: 16S rRNA processing protein RimM [Candidatus Manganitrophaceae bacterium]|nr:MAG: 16S rRNA processing protein RimM [Candidatus Manganitrophaceae bacterium]